jgi:hypothetical protein
MMGSSTRLRRRSSIIRLTLLEDRITPQAAMTPNQAIRAYGYDQVAKVNGTTLDGANQTIAIVDAYYDSHALSDLTTFDSMYGLPAFNVSGGPTFTQVGQTGGSPTGYATNSGWAGETALDIEWAHAIAPKANILLVESQDSGGSLYTAVAYAASHASQVSMSWGGGEGGTSESTFTSHTGVSFFASSGDTGSEVIYPSSSPNVVSVGGTSLTITGAASGPNYSSESAWSSGGGGPSTVFNRPSYQPSSVGSKRSTPDISYDSDPNTGFSFYNNGSWGQVGGTSDAAPQWAALLALANEGRVLEGLTAIDGPTQLLPLLYSSTMQTTGAYHDITTGSNGHAATTGYDQATGLGTPKAQIVIANIVAYGLPAQPTITTQPTNQSVTVGQTASFTAGASGNPTPTVQWQVSTNGGSTWSNISGATSTTYSFTTALSDNGHLFHAVFTNSNGNATTNSASLTTTTAAPTITTQPTPQSVTVGQNASFTAAASGAPTPTVQWQISTNSGGTWSNISGATSTTYSFTPAMSDSGELFRAVFTNSAGTANTNSASLTVAGIAPTMSTQPAPRVVTLGQTASFTATANGNPNPTVQWQVKPSGGTFNDIPGATSTTYTFTPSLSDSGDLLRAVFTNSAGSVTSTSAFLNVTSPVTIASIQVNDGSLQRSEVRSITVTFTGSVTFAGAAESAFQLTHVQNSTNVLLGSSVTTDGQGRTQVTLTFSGSETDALSAQNGALASLGDGRYTLSVFGSSINDSHGAAVDANNNGTLGSTYTSPADTFGGAGLGLYRLYGDITGDGVVDPTDLNSFRNTFNVNNTQANYIAALDANNDGVVDPTDLNQFRTRFNTNVF